MEVGEHQICHVVTPHSGPIERGRGVPLREAEVLHVRGELPDPVFGHAPTSEIPGEGVVGITWVHGWRLVATYQLLATPGVHKYDPVTRTHDKGADGGLQRAVGLERTLLRLPDGGLGLGQRLVGRKLVDQQAVKQRQDLYATDLHSGTSRLSTSNPSLPPAITSIALWAGMPDIIGSSRGRDRRHAGLLGSSTRSVSPPAEAV